MVHGSAMQEFANRVNVFGGRRKIEDADSPGTVKINQDLLPLAPSDDRRPLLGILYASPMHFH
jgi:hypothetical protein